MDVEPLTDVGLSALDAHMSATDIAMFLAEARGYLTAVASAPTLVRPGTGSRLAAATANSLRPDPGRRVRRAAGHGQRARVNT